MTTPALAITVNGVRRYANPLRHGGQPVYASVTQTVDAIAKPALNNWYAKTVATKAVERSATWLTMPATEAVKYLSQAPHEARNAGANRGTLTHEDAPRILSGQEPTSESGYTQALKALVRDLRPVTLATELTIFNETHLFAGTLDWLGRFEMAPDLGL